MELARTAAGSGVRYSFGLRSGEATREIAVDEVAGKVLQNPTEGKRVNGTCQSAPVDD